MCRSEVKSTGRPVSDPRLTCPDCCGPKTDVRSVRCKPCADVAKRSPGSCSRESCSKAAKTNGMCKNHAEKARLAALPFAACSVADCNKDTRYGSRGLCPKHYERLKQHGATGDDAISRRPNGAGGSRQELRRSYEGTRRARRRGQFVEHVDLATVWDRDGGVCHICRQPCERWNWHLDHVVSLARGGAHSYANVAVSHPGCNLKKGDR
jgi:hypothetical protein